MLPLHWNKRIRRRQLIPCSNGNTTAGELNPHYIRGGLTFSDPQVKYSTLNNETDVFIEPKLRR